MHVIQTCNMESWEGLYLLWCCIWNSIFKGLLKVIYVPWSQLKMNCDCAFPVTAHSTWNSLPEDLKYAFYVFLFKSYLKAYFYSIAFGNGWMDCFMCMYVWFVCIPFHITVPMATNAMWSCLFWFFFSVLSVLSLVCWPSVFTCSMLVLD